MPPRRSSSLALVARTEVPVVSEPEAASVEAAGRERRAHVRFDASQLTNPLVARVKYGDAVTLVDLSAGGAQFETSTPLRPDSTVVLEVTGAGAQETIAVVSRVVRCRVSEVRGKLRYRGACEFKRPLEHPALLPLRAVPPPPVESAEKPEVALKTIVEAYRRRAMATKPGASPADTPGLVDALSKLRAAADQHADPVDKRVAQMVGAVVPALRNNASADEVMGEVLVQLAQHIPASTIRVGAGARPRESGDVQRVTLNVWSESSGRSTLTAEYPSGFDVDETQFRLLRAGAYLLGLAASWSPARTVQGAVVPLQSAPPVRKSAAPFVQETFKSPSSEGIKDNGAELPAGWQRVVVRYLDGTLLRGFSNNFHPEAAHLHLSPDPHCPVEERLLVPIARLKAVFFVRNLSGNAEHVDSNEFDHAPRARKLEVTFRDGEVMLGSTLNYKPGGQGFYLAPANSRGNNQRVYVVLGAVRHLRFI